MLAWLDPRRLWKRRKGPPPPPPLASTTTSPLFSCILEGKGGGEGRYTRGQQGRDGWICLTGKREDSFHEIQICEISRRRREKNWPRVKRETQSQCMRGVHHTSLSFSLSRVPTLKEASAGFFSFSKKMGKSEKGGNLLARRRRRRRRRFSPSRRGVHGGFSIRAAVIIYANTARRKRRRKSGEWRLILRFTTFPYFLPLFLPGRNIRLSEWVTHS